MATTTQTRPQQQAKSARRPAPEPETQKPTTALAKTERAAVPSALRDRIRQDAGKGVSTDIADNLVPLIYVLQANSPPAMRGHQAYLKGAEAGDMLLRNAPTEDQIVKSDDGYLFQPCGFYKEWVEWMPERKGLADRHVDRPAVADQVEEEGDDGRMRKVWRMPSGNSVIETRYHYGRVHMGDGRRLPYVIPFSGTGHTVSKGWMFSMNSEADEEGNRLPAFALLYRLRTKLVTKNNNSWYIYDVEKEGYVESVEDYDAGLRLHEAFSSGAKKADQEDADLASETQAESGGDGAERDDGEEI